MKYAVIGMPLTLMELSDAAKIYRETAIKTAGKERMVIMLYEKTLQHLDAAVSLLQTGRFEEYDKVNMHITRAQEIILELSASLNKTALPKLCDDLLGLYLFFNKELREANFAKKPERILPVRAMLSDLLSAWKEAEKTVRAKDVRVGPGGLNITG